MPGTNARASYAFETSSRGGERMLRANGVIVDQMKVPRSNVWKNRYCERECDESGDLCL